MSNQSARQDTGVILLSTCCPGSDAGGAAVHRTGSAPLVFVWLCQWWKWKVGLSLDRKCSQSPDVLDWPGAEKGDRGSPEMSIFVGELMFS